MVSIEDSMTWDEHLQLMKLLSCLFIACACTSLLAQQTVGTFVNTPDAMHSLTFFSGFYSSDCYLIDNCGNVINHWDRNLHTANSAYFLENGLMLRTYDVEDEVGPIEAPSSAGGLELVDWDNNTVWQYEVNTTTYISHHDVAVLPNGNILVEIWEINEDLPSPLNTRWWEGILELEVLGTDEANIIWEWHLYDHLVQEEDPQGLFFGEVAGHPELVDINAPVPSGSDWTHMNSLDYHPEFDQILMSVRDFGEIWIIDHSTTTQQAASHEGGNYGKGGDLLYRWGNPEMYNRGTDGDRHLYGQHGAFWIKPGFKDEGKISLFNNGNGRPGTDYSIASIIDPPVDAQGNYIIDGNNAYLPIDPSWSYTAANEPDFFSRFMSNLQRLPNGNMLVNEGTKGHLFELDEHDEIVWDYVIPLDQDEPVRQGGFTSSNWCFMAFKYPLDYPGFQGKDLSPGDPIELDPLNNCELTTSITTKEAISKASVTLLDGVIKVEQHEGTYMKVRLLSADGKVYYDDETYNNQIELSSSQLKPGFYYVNVVLANGAPTSEKLFLTSTK